jgi:hypothetical protein
MEFGYQIRLINTGKLHNNENNIKSCNKLNNW